MQSTFVVCFTTLIAVCVCASVYELPGMDKSEFLKHLHFARNVGGGKLYCTLGSNDGGGLFGRAGFQGEIFNDQRGRFEGNAYGERVLGPAGDSSKLGTKFNWNNANDNARATLDVHKESGGGSGMTLSADGVWKVDKDTKFIAGGNLQKNFGHGKPEIGLEAKIVHDF